MANETSTTVIEVVSKAAPGVVLGAPSIFGFTINELAAMAGTIYSAVALGFMLWDRYRKWRDSRGSNQ